MEKYKFHKTRSEFWFERYPLSRIIFFLLNVLAVLSGIVIVVGLLGLLGLLGEEDGSGIGSILASITGFFFGFAFLFGVILLREFIFFTIDRNYLLYVAAYNSGLNLGSEPNGREEEIIDRLQDLKQLEEIGLLTDELVKEKNELTSEFINITKKD